jgi:hypothetical protein
MQHTTDVTTAKTEPTLPAVMPARLRLPAKSPTPTPDTAPLYIIARAPESIDEYRCWTIYALNDAPADVFEEWCIDAISMHNMATLQRNAVRILDGEAVTARGELIHLADIIATADHTWLLTEKWRVIATCTAHGMDWSKHWYQSRAEAIDALVARQRGITQYVGELAKSTLNRGEQR